MNAAPQISSELLVSFTVFANTYADSKTTHDDMQWSRFVHAIKNCEVYDSKEACPLISFCEFGNHRTENDALRNAANVQRVFGGEIDYDGGQVSIDAAAALLQAANITAVLYTTGTHSPQFHKWRALLPFGDPALPEKRAEYVARANRALGGIATSESFTLSQSFFIGRVRDREYLVRETHGRTIDLAADLEPLYFAGKETGEREYDETTDEDLHGVLKGPGPGRRPAMLKLAGRLAARHMAADDIAAVLHGLLSQAPDQGGQRRDEVDRMARQNVQKFGESRAQATDLLPADGKQSDPLAHIRASIVADLAAGPDAIDAAVPPQFIVYPQLPICGATLAGSGGTGKTTNVINEYIPIVAGGELYGHPVDKQGPCVIVTAEDGAAHVRYLQQRVLADGADAGVFPDSVVRCAKASMPVIGWPRAKFGPIVYVDQLGGFHRAAVFDLLLELLQPIKPVYVTLDPAVLFGAGERYLNDGDSFFASMIHEAALSLGCCFQVIDHVSQNVARTGIVDQYAARGGSAKSDNARMARQLVVYRQDDDRKADRVALPFAVTPEDITKGRVMQLHWTKKNYGPMPDPVWLLRRGYLIQGKRSPSAEIQQQRTHESRDKQAAADVDTVVAYITSKLAVGDGIRLTQNDAERADVRDSGDVKLTRARLREATQTALASRRLVYHDLPKAECKGSKKQFLAPP